MTKFKKMSRQNQKLLHWLIDCYAFHLASVDITNKRASEKIKLKGKPYWDFKAKEDLKKIFLRAKGDDFKDYKLSDRLKKRVYDGVSFVEGKHIPSDNKAQLLFEDLEEFIVTEFQNISMILEGTFSLALNLMSNDNAIAFTEFLYEFFIDNSIPMWQEIHELYRTQENRKWVYWMLKKKICAVCGKTHNEYTTVDLEHWKTISATKGTYKNDDGLDGLFLPLCREHHSEKHNIGVKSFGAKYLIQGVKLDEKMVFELLDIYPNQFKLFRKNLKEGKYGNLEKHKKF